MCLLLRVRRFFRDDEACPKRTFAERLPALVPYRARRTPRLTHALRAIGFATGGAAGPRLATRLHPRTSRETLLRLPRAAPPPPGGPASPGRPRRRMSRRHTRSGWTISRSAKAAPTARSSSIWSVVAPSTCYPIGRRTPSPPGYRAPRGSISSRATAIGSTRPRRPSEPPLLCRWWTASTCSSTRARSSSAMSTGSGRSCGGCSLTTRRQTPR